MKKAKRTSQTKKAKKVESSELYTDTVSFDEPRATEQSFNASVPEYSPTHRRHPSFMIMGSLLLIGVLIGMLVAYRGMPLVALVNGSPIFRWDIANTLFKRYGEQTLEGMVTEQLILSEGQKSGINVSQSDVDARAAEILKNFGSSMTVEDFLKFQGLEKQDFDNQIKLQLTVQQILGKDLIITDQDADAYIATNRATLVATEPAALKQEAINAIRDEKISSRIQDWLQEIKAKASIKRFL